MRWGLFLVALVVALAACGGGTEEAQPTPMPSPAVAQPSPTPEATRELTPTPTPEPAVQRIAYIGTDLDVWIINADGSGQQKLLDIETEPGDSVHNIRWSHDGSKFTVTKRGSEDVIYIVSAEGSGHTRLTDYPAADVGPVWSPDGAEIAFLSDRDVQLTFDIYVMNADGSNVTRLTTVGAGRFAWSPDGSRIAFASSCPPGGIHVINADGSGLTSVSDVPASDVDWSADGRRLAYLQFVEARGIGCGLYRGVVAHLDDNRIEPIVPDEEPTTFGKGPPIFSPTNPSLLAYGDGLMNLGKGQMQALPGTAVGWSPDGQHLLLGLETCEGAQVYDVESASSVLEFDISLRAFDAPCWYHLPRQSAWSPDRRLLATFDSLFGEVATMRTSVLHIGNVTTGDDKAVSVSSAGLLQPQFSPDGQHLLFSNPDGIWLVSSDGSSLILLVEGSSPAWQPQP